MSYQTLYVISECVLYNLYCIKEVSHAHRVHVAVLGSWYSAAKVPCALEVEGEWMPKHQRGDTYAVLVTFNGRIVIFYNGTIIMHYTVPDLGKERLRRPPPPRARDCNF